jgi:hypothetical protein
VHLVVRAWINSIHLIAATTADFHDVNLEGRSGILATCGCEPRPRRVASKLPRNGVGALNCYPAVIPTSVSPSLLTLSRLKYWSG